MSERTREILELTRRKLIHARRFFNENDLPETIHYVWVVFENCINIIKDAKDSDPVYEHKSKIDLYFRYYSLGFFKRDYSNTFALLDKLRIRADFGEYSQVPRIPDKKRVKELLDEAIELFAETESLLKKQKR